MRRFRLVLASATAACLIHCEAPNQGLPEAGPGVPEGPGTVTVWGRELGTMVAIYPLPLPDGSYALELQMTKDTVWVDFEAARAFAADSLGKALFATTREPFYTRDERCLFNPKKSACLEFLAQAPD